MGWRAGDYGAIKFPCQLLTWKQPSYSYMAFESWMHFKGTRKRRIASPEVEKQAHLTCLCSII